VVGGIDLSVGSVLGFSAGMTLFSLSHGAPVPLAVLIGVGTGAMVGLINGAIIAGLGVNDFIVTLATFSIVAGALQVLASKADLIGSDAPSFTSIAHSSPLGIPTPILITVVVLLLLEFVLLLTPFGRRIYAAGINSRAAHLAGVNVQRLRFQVYLLSGAIAGFAGVLLASHLNSVQPSLGSGFELTAIAAAVIGGISLAGGQGSVWRSVVGALFLSTLNQGLSLLGIDPVWFTIVTGASIVAAVAFSNGAHRLATSMTARAPRSPVSPNEPSAPQSSDATPAVTR
jgi:ribose transport system permease protein